MLTCNELSTLSEQCLFYNFPKSSQGLSFRAVLQVFSFLPTDTLEIAWHWTQRVIINALAIDSAFSEHTRIQNQQFLILKSHRVVCIRKADTLSQIPRSQNMPQSEEVFPHLWFSTELKNIMNARRQQD